MPKVRFFIHPSTQLEARKNTAQLLYNFPAKIDMHTLWEKRNTIDAGAYTLYTRSKPPKNMNYPSDIAFSMSCIGKYPQEVRLFAHYAGEYWTSYEYLVSYDAAGRILKECFAYTGSDLYQDFRSSTPGGLALFLIRDTETLKNTIGFLDYNETDREIVGNNVWFSYSYLSLK